MLIITADPNVKIEQGEKGLYLAHVDVPISMRDDNNIVQGGIRLTPEEDNISLADNFDKFKELAITKMKKLVAEANYAEPEPVPDDEPVPLPEDKSPKNVTIGDTTKTSVTIGGE